MPKKDDSVDQAASELMTAAEEFTAALEEDQQLQNTLNAKIESIAWRILRVSVVLGGDAEGAPDGERR